MSIIDEALARQAARPKPRPIDYERMNREFPKQKAALTRAMNAWRKVSAGDRFGEDPRTQAAAEKVAAVCKKTVAEWNACGSWPDDWARWQRSLDDVLGWNSSLQLEDL